MLTPVSFVKSITSRQRTVLLKMMFFLLSIIIIFRLYNLQIVNGSFYAATELGQRPELSEIVPPRGNIYMKDDGGNHSTLAATNRPMPVVYVVPKQIDNPEIILSAIESLIEIEIDDVERDDLLRRMSNKNSTYAKIKGRMTEEDAEIVRGAKLQGVYVGYEDIRYYLYKERAAQVLGYFGHSNKGEKGRYGIEGYFEDELVGKPGFARSLPLLGIGEEKVYSPGEDIYLTIDRVVQFQIEKELEKVVEKYDAESGNAIVMDPKTGAIIAMANYPFFDPNNYREVEDIAVYRNNTIGGLYEPGSVFKPITMGVALDSESITPTTVYNDLGAVDIGEDRIHNVNKIGYGEQTMTNVLERSLNTGTIFAMKEMGYKQFSDYLDRFHLEDKTDLPLTGEQYGNLENISKGSPEVQFATASFGQGILMTPLRLITAIATFANDGKMMQPYIVEKRVDHKGNVIETKPRVAATPVSSFTATRLTEMLVSTAEKGYGSRVSVPGYSIAAKTGTAQIANENGTGYSEDTIHSFIGYAPAYDPKFIVLIRMDRPKTEAFALNTLSSVFRNIALHILQYYGVPTDK